MISKLLAHAAAFLALSLNRQSSALPSLTVSSHALSISPTQKSFSSYQDVVVGFSNPEGTPSWVAIGFVEAEVNGKLPDDYSYIVWSMPCGSPYCEEEVTEGQITFHRGSFLSGTYIAFLLEDNDHGAPYNIISSSTTFTVQAAERYLSLDKEMYIEGESMKTTFNVPNVVDTNWIALSPAGATVNGFVPYLSYDAFLSWSWLYCGGTICNGPSAQGVIEFTKDIPIGDYQMHLVLSEDPFVIGASSEIFSVVAAPTSIPSTPPTPQPTTASPTSSPTASPTTSPTSSPTLSPTATPTTATPTLSPTPFLPVISSSQAAYEADGEISVTFLNPNATADNWIGISEEGNAQNGYLLSTEIWSFTSGTQNYDEAEATHRGGATFVPCSLPTGGTYQAHLLEDRTLPYVVKASSEPFTVHKAETSISSSQATYTGNEHVVITVSDQCAQPSWIALKQFEPSFADMPFYVDSATMAWSMSCGNQVCYDFDTEGGAIFLNGTLPPGTYEACLLKDSLEAPYVIFSTSEQFTVV